MTHPANGVPHVYNGVVILCRGDGYWNATAMCQANGKLWGHYYENRSTRKLLDGLSRSIGIPIDQLVQTVTTGPNVHRGTWVHRRVAIDLARWCSVDFAVMMNGWVEELLTKGRVELPQARPQATLVRAWTERIMPAYEAHRRHIFMNHPAGSWSILTAALGETLLTEDECLRHCLPTENHDLPDGSMGQMYARFRDGRLWARQRRTSPLVLPNWRRSDGADVTVAVAIYDADERRFFERWLATYYIPQHLPRYLENKFPRRRYGLASVSAADNSSRRITGRRAALPALDLWQIDQAGGRIPATAALGRPPEQRSLFDDSGA
jgi:hypothetical protein